MNFVDTHCHLNYLSDTQKAIANAHTVGVEDIIVPATSLGTFREIENLSQQNKRVYWAAGWHPSEIASYCEGRQHDPNALEPLKTVLEKRPDKLVAIGECGLDFYYETDPQKQLRQRKIFERHLELGNMYKLPVIIHTRKADKEVLDSLSAFPALTGVFHCFSGSKKLARAILETSFYFGIGGLITLDTGLAQVATIIPLDRIVLETDSPYLIPKTLKHIMKENEPSAIVVIAQKIAQIKKVPVEEVAQKTTTNARKLFSLPTTV